MWCVLQQLHHTETFQIRLCCAWLGTLSISRAKADIEILSFSYGWIQCFLILQLDCVLGFLRVYFRGSWDWCLLVIGFVTTGLCVWSWRRDCDSRFERESEGERETRRKESALIWKCVAGWHRGTMTVSNTNVGCYNAVWLLYLRYSTKFQRTTKLC